jgi:pimeloyl-ACP methyl ester carboxylesterase
MDHGKGKRKMNIPEDQYIKAGSVNTRYWVVGEGEPVLLLHGVTNSVEDWLLNVEALAESYRVFAVDLMGHGKTDKPATASYHINDHALFITTFMDAIQVKQASIVGHSLGGWITLDLAINHPTYVNKLVLVDPAGLGKETPTPIRLLTLPGLGEILGSMFLKVDFGKFLETQRQNWPDAEVVPDEMIRLKYEATRQPDLKPTILKTLRALVNIFGTKESAYLPVIKGLPSIKKPMLVIWGREDKLAPVAWTRIIADSCPQAMVEIFDDCGHDAMVEKPDKFNKLVREFLKD